ncbi:MerR family transcriptional regulator [Pelagicoccus sp. SDUM812002]|uniref:MerR family transcriptional regulator n=1 Tax=Pelagicoccus sp. SDUM812002 TaxID=3041266 RepID=UPI00280C8CBA|nr:MerR family transcriptional regulator [Pelagicoccus sp. SDUM812002]MDQ8187176.1 MerR family transcriptional regulator [Pelagicoccus sp. SDUM812002]
MQYSIGEFSQITRASVKALRLYHEKGVLVPDFVDPESGYRYYSQEQVGEARVVANLKELGFSLSEIKEVLDSCEEDDDLLDRLQEKRRDLEKRVKRFQDSIADIELVVSGQFAESGFAGSGESVVEKTVPDMLVAGHRIRGHYSEAGQGFRILGRRAGRVLTGKPMCLYFDGEYRDQDANFEPCFEVKKVVDHELLYCRKLAGGLALTLLHRGPYERLYESYAKLFAEVKSRDLRLLCPSREVYHKGPGMILRGNSKKYLTEIQFLVQ